MLGVKDLEDLVVFPVLGPEKLQTAGLEPEPEPTFSGFSRSNLIFSPEQLDLKTVPADGVGRQVLLDSGFSGNAQEEVRRVSLGVAEQRGFSSPVRGCGPGKEISNGATGSKEGGGVLVKKWRKS